MKGSNKAFMALLASLLYLAVTNIIWIAIDTRPPFWDMANHALWGIDVFRDFQDNGIAALHSVPRDSGSYPPLYYLVIALSYRLLGTSIDAAQLANIPAIIILALATYGIARSLLDPMAAAFAGILVNFFPFMLWISRETLIEYWLVALVALSIWALLKTKEFSDLRWSLLFGVVCGLGMLTKWTFAIFVILPALWAARKHWANALKAAAIAAVLSAYWYVPQAAMLSRAWQTAAAGGLAEGDPLSFSIQGFLFYIRGLEGYQLFLPLFILFCVGAFVILYNWSVSFPKWTPIALYVLGGWCGLMLLPNKDPRYSAALLPGIAVTTVVVFAGKHRRSFRFLQVVLVGFLILQHILVSFGISRLPERVVLAEGPAGAVPYDWNLYTQTYFGLWGKPEKQDWQIERILHDISADARTRAHPVKLGLIPDLPRFDVPAFQFYITLNRLPVVVDRVLVADEAAIFDNDYVLMSLGEQTAFGSPTPHAEEINAYILKHPDRFEMVDMFSLPNGGVFRLYHCLR